MVRAACTSSAVATFAGNDAYGWIAAALTGAVLVAAQRARGTSQTCAISPPAAVHVRDEDDRADLPLR